MDARSRAVAALAKLLASVAAGEMDGAAMAVELRQLADRVDSAKQRSLPGMPAPAPDPADEDKAKAKEERAIVERVFAYWQSTLGHPTAKLTPERAAKIRIRLSDGYTEENLRRAIRGCAASPHHTGSNETGTRYDDLTLILRTGSKVEQFAAMAREETRTRIAGATAEQVQQAEAIEKEALDAMERGDMDAYNRANRRLAGIRGA